MSKATMKKLISFLKMLKAPIRLLPYVLGFVLAFVRHCAENDNAQTVQIEEHGFVCHRWNEIWGGCGSPCIAEYNGGMAAVYVCSRVVNNVLVHSLCMVRSSSAGSFVPGTRTFLYTTPLHLGSVTAVQTPAGLLVSWHKSTNALFRAPSTFGEYEAARLRADTASAVSALPDGEKQDGYYYAFVKNDGEPFDKIYKAPEGVAQAPVVLSGSELMWLGVENGKAVAYRSTDTGKSFSPAGEVPQVEAGRTYSEVCCARLKNGRLIAIMSSAGEMYISYSDDMGTRWSRAKPMHTKGIAPNLCVRDDGVLALCYVVRDKTLSIRCRVSNDGQYVWGSERIAVASVGENCRRPYTAQLGGKFITVSRLRFCGEKESSVVYTLWKPHKDDVDETEEKNKK